MVRVAIGELAEGRHQDIGTIAAKRADDIARRASRRVSALDKREIAASGGSQKRFEISARVVRNGHGNLRKKSPARWPG
jgi:hypothetical protein